MRACFWEGGEGWFFLVVVVVVVVFFFCLFGFACVCFWCG